MGQELPDHKQDREGDKSRYCRWACRIRCRLLAEKSPDLPMPDHLLACGVSGATIINASPDEEFNTSRLLKNSFDDPPEPLPD